MGEWGKEGGAGERGERRRQSKGEIEENNNFPFTIFIESKPCF